MATFNLVITYSDGEQARILTAIKAAATTNVNPSPTNAQAIEWLRQSVAGFIRTTVKDYETRAALAAVVDVGVT